MTKLIIDISLATVSFISMEAVAWFAHKYLMHGCLWRLHRDHHKKDRSDFLEHNDLFFMIFATPGITSLALGTYTQAKYLLFIGVGVTLYGLCYFLVHDIFIHQRIKMIRNSNNRYLRGFAGHTKSIINIWAKKMASASVCCGCR